jgi:mRNA interferase MazF
MVMAYYPKQGDIVYMDFDPQTGREQAGRRPAVVVSNRLFNKFGKGIALVAPITNTDKGITLHVRLDERTKITGVVLTDQIKALDLAKRQAEFVESMPSDKMKMICAIVSSFSEHEGE